MLEHCSSLILYSQSVLCNFTVLFQFDFAARARAEMPGHLLRFCWMWDAAIGCPHTLMGSKPKEHSAYPGINW